MFTGYIDHCAKIHQIETMADGQRLHITHRFPDLTMGESIAISGICLSVTAFTTDSFSCDVSPETLAVTTAQYLTAGSPVNLERSLRLNDRLHGHFVLGHVDQICRVSAKKSFTDYVEYTFSGLLPQAQSLFVSKGSVAINGVSLTLNQVVEDRFSVMLIPETLRNTNLSTLNVGDWVNIEYDYLAKLINRQTQMLEHTRRLGCHN